MQIDRFVMMAVLLLASVLIGDAAAAEEWPNSEGDGQSSSTPVPESAAVSAQETEESKQAEAARQKAARRKIVAGLIIVGGLLVLGVAVLVLTVLWAHRLRRIARQALPTQHTGDDLWYLRPSKTTLPGSCNSDATSAPERASDDFAGDSTDNESAPQ
jgi:hypothetical protein